MLTLRSFAIPAALCSLLLTACGKAPLVAAGPALADGRDAAQAAALALGKVDPANYQPVSFAQAREAAFQPQSAARKALTGKRIQFSCLAVYTLPTTSYTDIEIELYNSEVPPRDDKSVPKGIYPKGFAKSLFYLHSEARKVAWLEGRGVVEMSHDIYDGKHKVPAVTVFAVVNPVAEVENAHRKAFTFHAVRRADGKMFSL
jgi:hypothetical protein